MTPTDRARHAADALADAAAHYHGTQRVLSLPSPCAPPPPRWCASCRGSPLTARTWTGGPCPRRGAGRGLQGCQQRPSWPVCVRPRTGWRAPAVRRKEAA